MTRLKNMAKRQIVNCAYKYAAIACNRKEGIPYERRLGRRGDKLWLNQGNVQLQI